MEMESQLMWLGWISVITTWIIKWKFDIQQEENREWKRVYFTLLVMGLMAFLGVIVIG